MYNKKVFLKSWLTFGVPIRPTIVNYDGCFVDTTNGAMNVLSGIFSVSDPGIYQLSFTAKYVSSNRGRFGAWSDIYVNQTVRGQCKLRTPEKMYKDFVFVLSMF